MMHGQKAQSLKGTLFYFQNAKSGIILFVIAFVLHIRRFEAI